MFRRSLIVVFLSLLALESRAAEWQYAGYVGGKQPTHQFFDAQSLTRPKKDVVRVWLKSIKVSELDRYFATHESALVEKSAQRVASGQTPRFFQLPVIRAKYSDA